MSDPIRWLDEGADAFPHERELLDAGRSMEPPPGAAETIWANLGPHIGPGAGGGGGSSGNTAANGSSGMGSSGASITSAVGSVKAAAVGIAGIVTIAGAIAAFVAPPAANPVTNVAPAHSAVEAVRSSAVDDPPANEPIIEALGSDAIVSPATSSTIATEKPPERIPPRRVPDAKPIPSVAIVPAEDGNEIRQERASRLREESRILGDARAALRSGDPASALKKLDAAGGQFPDGTLAQEREVLAIESLSRAGQHAAASARAVAFLQTYPTSPHAKKVRGFIQ